MVESKTNWNQMNRRTFLKKAGNFYFGLIATSGLIGTYSFKVERFWYEIKEVQLKVKNLPEAFKGWKIVQFSDIHLGFHYGIEDFKQVINMINHLKPDTIFFTGDFIEVGNKEPELYIPLLKELKVPRGGKWAVIGNHDFIAKDQITYVLEKAQFRMLNNSHDLIEYNDQHLYVAGLDDVMYGEPNIQKAIDGIANNECILLLSHEPDIADQNSKYSISAQFSGHSHGGQFRLPFYGSIIKQGFAKKYIDGLYEVGENKMPLYVNRGIGTTELAIRFFCRPEITVFHLS